MQPTILVVDDEEMTRNLLRLMLERNGYAIVEADGGQEALDIINTSVPDLVLLDVMMPDLDGFTVCQSLRSQPKTADLPVIMLSARTQNEAVRAGLLAGANHYMTKPISRPELIQTIEELLSGLKSPQNNFSLDDHPGV